MSCAVALANLDIFESEDLLGNVLRNENAFRSTLERLQDLPIVGDVRGDGYFFGIELVKDQATKATFSTQESERILRDFVSPALFDRGLYCRADDRGDTVVQVAPPLISGQARVRRDRVDPAVGVHRRLGPAPPVRAGLFPGRTGGRRPHSTARTNRGLVWDSSERSGRLRPRSA